LLVRLTSIPPVGAAPVRVAVPVDVANPVTVVGLSVIDAMVGGLMVSVADWVTDPSVAEMLEII